MLTRAETRSRGKFARGDLRPSRLDYVRQATTEELTADRQVWRAYTREF